LIVDGDHRHYGSEALPNWSSRHSRVRTMKPPGITAILYSLLLWVQHVQLPCDITSLQ